VLEREREGIIGNVPLHCFGIPRGEKEELFTRPGFQAWGGIEFRRRVGRDIGPQVGVGSATSG